MKAQDIVLQLQSVLPRFSSLFTDSLAVSSLTSVSNTVTAITSSAHGLATGDPVNIRGAVIPNLLTSLTQVDNVATGIANNKTDLTADDGAIVTVLGAAQADYNGTFPLLSVSNDRKTFTYQSANDPTSPATGTPTLTETLPPRTLQGTQVGLNGQFQITVIDDTTFSYTTANTPDVLAIGTIFAEAKYRIARVVNLDEIFDAYTAQADENSIKDLWAFVSLGDNDVNKDRNAKIDGIGQESRTDDARQRIIQPFSVWVVAPTSKDLTGAIARDLMEDVAVDLYRSLLGVEFNSLLSEQRWSKVTAVGHNFSTYIKAYYVHQFVFETVKDINIDDTAQNENHVPFECIDLSIAISENDKAPTLNASFLLP